MIISEQWLRDWVSLDLDVKAISDCLTNAGLEVDGVNPLAGPIDNLVVGKVLEVSKHPDADRLSLTKVDIGSEQLEIVCGASNVRPDLLVAVATIGAKLPNGLKIKLAKVRGVTSNGMLCSTTELGLEDDSIGIMELDNDAEIGQRVDEYLQLNDHLIDIDLTPNRGDCLSVQGIARELKVLANGDYHPLDISEIEATIKDGVELDLQNDVACSSYFGRVIKGIDPRARTPIWMQERLRRASVRPISPVVDITNYVMLELGQPMHAFDKNKLNGKITIRSAVAGEKIKLLDDSEVELNTNTLVIADDKGPLAIAGVMGGANSAIDDNTTDIVLEAAHFTRQSAAGCARSYGLHTESSHRFERGVDPKLPAESMQRATDLVLQICGGEAGPVCRQIAELKKVKPVITLRLKRLQQLLGMPLAQVEVAEILSRVADEVTQSDGEWTVTSPSYRFDIQCEADLIEEVARVKGYENIPTAVPRIAPTSMVASEAKISVRRVRQTLLARDYNEAITYSFIDPASHKNFSTEPAVVLSNPLAENLSVMRSSLLPGLLAALQFNTNRQHDRVRLFEIGATYHKAKASYKEVPRVAGVITGSVHPAQWSADKVRNVDFYDAKADVEALLSLTGQKKPFIFKEFDHISAHPAQVSKVSLPLSPESLDSTNSSDLGFVARLHPGLQKQYDLPSNVFVFELDLDIALQAKLPAFNAVSKFPSIKRDLSVVVEQDLAVADLLQAMRGKLGNTLVAVSVFDVYAGDGVEDGFKSVSLSFTLQYLDKTMAEEDAEALMKKALLTLQQEFKAEIRS